ncbi:hypothetical protein SAMN05443550_105305 [Pedobacter hartonius]|uniref:Uncharacterized protein n=1 Tax=Pedobacter hartonius TaxID=425514 RepID=A0A1H4EBF3_9SPHI|nr:hypothetical protein SAMN05443550_105305 [Pedobacter hartonius]
MHRGKLLKSVNIVQDMVEMIIFGFEIFNIEKIKTINLALYNFVLKIAGVLSIS